MNIIIAILTKWFPGTNQVVHQTNQVVHHSKRPSENTATTWCHVLLPWVFTFNTDGKDRTYHFLVMSSLLCFLSVLTHVHIQIMCNPLAKVSHNICGSKKLLKVILAPTVQFICKSSLLCPLNWHWRHRCDKLYPASPPRFVAGDAGNRDVSQDCKTTKAPCEAFCCILLVTIYYICV